MATVLYRIGLWAYARPWRVIGAWIVLVAALAAAALSLGGSLKNSYTIPGTESQQAIEKLEAVFPQTAGASIQVVFQAPEGDSVEDEPYRTGIADTIDEITGIDGVESVADPFSEYAVDAVSEDGRAAIAQVTLDAQQEDVPQSTVDAVLAAGSIGEDAGMSVSFGGSVLQETSVGVTIVEAFGVLFAAIVLVITFGSLLAAGMPLLIAFAGVGVAMTITLITAAFTPVSTTAPMLALMIGLAVGIDYSLFIVSRHRNQLAVGMEPRESAGTATATAGSAVVFAGLTVIIALLGLLVVGIPFLSIMGVTAAVAVLFAVLAAVTMLPALLGLAKGRLAPKPGSRSQRRALAQQPGAAEGRPSLGTRWVKLVTKVPIIPVVLVVAGLGALAIPASQLQLSLPDNGSEPVGSTQREAYDAIAESFGPGRNGPLIVLVDITQTTDVLGVLEDIRDDLEDLDDVRAVGQGIPNPTVDTAILQVIPGSGPTSPETTALVERIRELAPQIEDDYDTPIAVTGTTAVFVDISSTLANALIPFASIVVGLSILLLMMVFRSLFVPLKAALGFVLSLSGAIGAVVLVFQQGFGAELFHAQTGPILSFLPIIIIAVLFGLAMDYEVFLVSGMREEFVRTRDAKASVVAGFSHAARVVTAAALIMFFVFFAFVPEGAQILKAIAFALAAGVFFDAFLVRMTLVPALMALAGRAAWYLPRWLQRVLPNVDIEGESLAEHREGLEWAAEQDSAVSAEDLVVVGSNRRIDVTVPSGGLCLLVSDEALRHAVFATLAGRVAPVSGRVQVLGLPLPSDAAAVSRRLAIVEPDTIGADPDLTVGDLLHERLALAGSVFTARRRAAHADALLERAARALHAEGLPRIEADERAGALHSDARVALAVTLAIASGADAIAVDLGDGAPSAIERSLRLIDAIASASTTILAGSRIGVVPQPASGRPARVADIERKAVLS